MTTEEVSSAINHMSLSCQSSSINNGVDEDHVDSVTTALPPATEKVPSAATDHGKKLTRFQKQKSMSSAEPAPSGLSHLIQAAKLIRRRSLGSGGEKSPESHANSSALTDGQSDDGGKFRVLVAINAYPWSMFAFDWYLKNVHQADNEVICYHTMERPVVHGDEFCVNVDAFNAVMKGCESNAKDLHDEYMRKMEEHQVKGHVVVQFTVIGAGEAIVEAAQREKVKMIVVGSRGKGTIRRTLTGSVSDYVTRHARCPVIVCCQERPRRRSSRLSTGNSFSEEEVN